MWLLSWLLDKLQMRLMSAISCPSWLPLAEWMNLGKVTRGSLGAEAETEWTALQSQALVVLIKIMLCSSAMWGRTTVCWDRCTLCLHELTAAVTHSLMFLLEHAATLTEPKIQTRWPKEFYNQNFRMHEIIWNKKKQPNSYQTYQWGQLTSHMVSYENNHDEQGDQ